MNKTMIWFATLSVWYRMAILITAFLIPVVFLASAVTKTELEKLAVLQDEIGGIELIELIDPVSRSISEHREQTLIAASGDSQNRRTADETVKNIGFAAFQIDEHIKSYGTSLDIAEHWEQIKQTWITLRDDASSLTGKEIASRHNQLIGELDSLRVRVTEASGLLFDENPGNHFLIMASAVELPALLQALTDLRADAVSVSIKGGELSNVTKQRLVTGQDRVRLHLERAQYNIARAVDFVPNLAPVYGQRIVSENATFNYLKKMNAVFLQSEKVVQGAGRTFKDGMQAMSLLEEYGMRVRSALRDRLEQHHAKVQGYLTNTLLFLVAGIVIAITIAVAISRGITGCLPHLSDVAKRVAGGERGLRTQVPVLDETGLFARQFDIMLDQQDEAQRKAEEDYRQVNASVRGLLDAVTALAQRDFSSRVPVAEDVTGALSNAINLMTEETTTVLEDVLEVASGLAEASDAVRKQADIAMNAAIDDKTRIDETADELKQTFGNMTEIGRLAAASGETAGKAIATGDQARQTVLGTVEGITGIHRSVHQAEKRFKRLGERAQEIVRVVDLINDIADRTHILSLNASIQSTLSDDAGRNVSTVANDIQRLADNARDAASQVSGLVESFQTEIAGTVNILSETVARVANGIQLVERAGMEMENNQAVMGDLLEQVNRIDDVSGRQIDVARRLVERAAELKESKQLANEVMKKQTLSTTALVQYSERLIHSVSGYTLSESANISAEDVSSEITSASGHVKRAA